MSEDIYFCYVTCPDKTCALNLAQLAVSNREAACANILPQMTSVYSWEDKIETSDEVVLILKTSALNIPALRNLVILNHPYDCPCFVAWQLHSGHLPFFNWISENTFKTPPC